jgi:membrane-associated phospholipid phosphatase
LRRRRRPNRRLALVAAAIGAAAPILRHRLELPKAVTSALVWQTPVWLALAFPRSRARDAALYGAQMWAYMAHYEMPNDDPDELLARVHVDYPIAIDRVIGLGETPTVRLQRLLGRSGEVRPHDTLLAWVHWAWFFFPHGTVLYVLLRHRDRYERSAALMAATFDAGLAGYWLLPTAPPWWAGRASHRRHVRRIMVEAGKQFWGSRWEPLYDSLGGNPFAAMPSLHFATSVTSARVLSDTGPVAGALGWSYAMTLGFALVYLGEHYVVDLLAGFALAEAVRRAEPRALPALRALKGAVQTLEPRRP